MAFRYVEIDEAMAAPGLRMVVVQGVPSPWSEAAKGIFHIKGIDWLATYLSYDSEPLKAWCGGQRHAPVAVLGDERPRERWNDILLMAERIAPAPALLPQDPAERALAMGLSHEICGEGGLGWSRRLQMVDAGLRGEGGFALPVAKYLAKKYGGEQRAAAGERVRALLGMLAARLHAQRGAGSDYYLGRALTAVDIYSAAFMALFAPLPPEQCAMKDDTRAAFESLDDPTRAALDPVLLAHRDMMYARHLALPLAL